MTAKPEADRVAEIAALLDEFAQVVFDGVSSSKRRDKYAAKIAALPAEISPETVRRVLEAYNQWIDPAKLYGGVAIDYATISRSANTSAGDK